MDSLYMTQARSVRGDLRAATPLRGRRRTCQEKKMSVGGPSHSALACRARRRCHAAPEATPSYNRPGLDAVDATATCDVSVKRWEGCPQARKRKRGKSESGPDARRVLSASCSHCRPHEGVSRCETPAHPYAELAKKLDIPIVEQDRLDERCAHPPARLSLIIPLLTSRSRDRSRPRLATHAAGPGGHRTHVPSHKRRYGGAAQDQQKARWVMDRVAGAPRAGREGQTHATPPAII